VPKNISKFKFERSSGDACIRNQGVAISQGRELGL